MSRVLIATWPFAGHIFPQIALAHALRRRGHEPAFYTAGKAAGLLAAEGFRHFPFQALDEERLQQVVLNPERGSLHWGGFMQFQKTLNDWLLGTIDDQVTDLQQI